MTVSTAIFAKKGAKMQKKALFFTLTLLLFMSILSACAVDRWAKDRWSNVPAPTTIESVEGAEYKKSSSENWEKDSARIGRENGGYTVVLKLVMSSGSYRPVVTSYAKNGNVLDVNVTVITPGEAEAGTCDMAYWLIFFPVDNENGKDVKTVNVTRENMANSESK